MPRLSAHFDSEEFRCPDCGVAHVEPELVSKLEQLRHAIGDKPLQITSGYRCRKHNKAVGGAPDSQHCLGTAADVAAEIPYADLLAASLKVFASGGVGEYPEDGHVHVDVRPTPARWSGNG
jgi:zinc D-Ala-D-Ala carboxypeptidase